MNDQGLSDQVTAIVGVGKYGRKLALNRNLIHALVIAEVVETLHAIQTKQLIEGSVARVSDCCPQPVDALECIAKLGGICRATDYPKNHRTVSSEEMPTIRSCMKISSYA